MNGMINKLKHNIKTSHFNFQCKLTISNYSPYTTVYYYTVFETLQLFLFYGMVHIKLN